MTSHPISSLASFGHRFAMLHRLQMNMCRGEILAAGIQPSWFPFMARLTFEEEPVTQDYLTKALAIDKGTTARAVKQLEKRGYVTRQVNPENRRQNLISATGKAKDVTYMLISHFEKSMRLFMKDFSEEECVTILTLMDRMIANAKEALNEQ